VIGAGQLQETECLARLVGRPVTRFRVRVLHTSGRAQLPFVSLLRVCVTYSHSHSPARGGKWGAKHGVWHYRIP
jgi:hypothetical protein